jgi:hypothetical protein
VLTALGTYHGNISRLVESSTLTANKVFEKVLSNKPFKNARMQGARNHEE